VFPGGEQQLSRPLNDFTHGLDGVDEQIEDHLLQLDPISQNGRQVTRKMSLYRDATSLRFAAR
jgi:hypothetical protein